MIKSWLFPQQIRNDSYVTEVLTIATMAVMLKYIDVSNKHMIHFKFIQYLSNILKIKMLPIIKKLRKIKILKCRMIS